MGDSKWPSEWLRGVLTAAVLSIVSDEETYGYLIGRRLAEGGLGIVKGGTLYPLLTRLEQDGEILATWRDGDGGPGRKYYAITPAGSQRLNSLRADWQIFAGHATRIILGKQAGI
jgi:PadR family transcriptional regulator PadR